MNRNIMQIDFSIFESTLECFQTTILLGLEGEEDLVQNALNEHPVVLDKPIVPSLPKNAKGYVLFKSQPAKPNVVSEANGIYLRNDGSNYRVIPTKLKAPVADDLDEILALEPKQETKSVKTSLPRPGSIMKKSAVTENKQEKDDDAWLDDLLG